MILGAIGDRKIVGDLYLTTDGKKVILANNSLTTSILASASLSESYTLTLPPNSGLTGSFLGGGDDAGTLQWISSAAYDGDIQSVWNDASGDVSGIIAASDDSLDATLADSTIPWKVATTGTPTTEGKALWDSDDNFLKVGDGTNTTAIGPPTYPPTSPTASGVIGQMAYDSKYVYVYTDTNVWKRAALSTYASDDVLLQEDGWKILLEGSDWILLE